MFVKLQRNFFGPDGMRYRAKRGGGLFVQDVPVELDKLPSDAVVYDKDGKEPVGTVKELRDGDKKMPVAETKKAEK